MKETHKGFLSSPSLSFVFIYLYLHKLKARQMERPNSRKQNMPDGLLTQGRKLWKANERWGRSHVGLIRYLYLAFFNILVEIKDKKKPRSHIHLLIKLNVWELRLLLAFWIVSRDINLVPWKTCLKVRRLLGCSDSSIF